jgi:alkanesulfonate monooxygenase SsuD/methylene tetrahydromethanopterin reductase-like flavin-dependent oxidoreductase (luciferase family)
MQYGAHLPLIDFDGDGWRPDELNAYVDAARETGFSAISANDHLVFQRPWLDGLVALASVIHRTGDMMLATTVSLPVVRNPIALAKQAAAIDIISGGRLVLGIGPGSSSRDYVLMGLNFEERWRRFEEAIRVLRCHLCGEVFNEGAFYPVEDLLQPSPSRPNVPIWLGSWGSDAGLRRVARLADGWLASAYNTTPFELRSARDNLAVELRKRGKDPEGFPCGLATMWTYVTDTGAERHAQLMKLSQMLNRPPGGLGDQVIIGPAEECARKLRAYAEAGVDTVFIWPLADGTEQLERFMTKVAPLV